MPRPGLAPRLVLLVGSLLFTLGLLELALITIGYSSTPIDIQVGTGDTRSLHVFDDDNFEYDPDLIWRPRRSQSIFNSQGFRGPELTLGKPPGRLRLFAVGDSNTLGWAGADGPNWPHDLQELLTDDVTVVNAGVWGYASYQGVTRFRETLAFDPDIVLISFGSNDAHRVLRADRDYAFPIREGSAGRLLGRFRLGDLLLAAIERVGRTDAPVLQPRVSLEDYRANLTAIVTEARSHGVAIVLLTRPYVGEIPNPIVWKNWAADYNAATAEVAEELDVPLIDVYSFFKGRDELFADESHFTAEGHEQAAGVILDHIRPLVESRRAAGEAPRLKMEGGS
jgi:lysophospholipase L1-like esterase